MADPVYLLLAEEVSEWFLIKGYSSKLAARNAAIAFMKKHTDKDRVDDEDEPSEHREGTWRFWEKDSSRSKKPAHFPGRILESWSANSVGGIDGNPWSRVAVAELPVEENVLERLAEVTSGSSRKR